MELIYLDNSATTPMLPAVWEAMRPFAWENPGNPASSHQAGRRARQALENARELVAHLVDADPQEVLFTSGATEANNLAVFGLCGQPPGHIVTSPIEHPSVLEPIRQLEQIGFRVTRLAVNGTGEVIPESDHFSADTRLVAVMLANHETGAVQPIENLAKMVAGRAAFHCDAAAAAGKIPVSFKSLGVSSLTLCAHKFHGPKGVGALILKRNAKLKPLLWGGHQQQSKRPGTESVALAVGMAAALELAVRDIDANRRKVLELRKRFLACLAQKAAPLVVNGPTEGAIPHIINVSFPGCAADLLLMNLDLAGIACSTGSACSSGSLLPSPVLNSMGLKGDLLRSAMRFSLSPLLERSLIDEAANRISICINDLRSPTRIAPAVAASPE